MMLTEIRFRLSSHRSLGKLCSLGTVTRGSYPVMRVCFVRLSEQENMGCPLKKTKTNLSVLLLEEPGEIIVVNPGLHI